MSMIIKLYFVTANKMSLNITCTLTPEQITQMVHSQVVLPLIYIYTFIVLFIFLLIGLILVHIKKSKPIKYIVIWFISTIFVLLVLAFIIINPNVVQNISIWFSSLFT